MSKEPVREVTLDELTTYHISKVETCLICGARINLFSNRQEHVCHVELHSRAVLLSDTLVKSNFLLFAGVVI